MFVMQENLKEYSLKTVQILIQHLNITIHYAISDVS